MTSLMQSQGGGGGMLELTVKLSYEQRENDLVFYQILSSNSLRKCMEIGLKNLNVDIGGLRG